MARRRKQPPQHDGFVDNGFVDNGFIGRPFVEEFADWIDSPEGALWIDISDALDDLLKDVQLDAGQRQFIWADGARLDLEQSVARIHQRHPDFPADKIEEFLIDWIRIGYAPEHYSQAQLDELENLTEPWIADHRRRPKTAKKAKRTSHS